MRHEELLNVYQQDAICATADREGGPWKTTIGSVVDTPLLSVYNT
jgi:hypothetical protein